MATAVLRPAHRRQGSDQPLPSPGAATSTVTLDGRLLEIHDPQQRGRPAKEEDGRGPAKPQVVKTVARPPPINSRALPHDKAPMTPPRVSGVSLAPIDHLAATAAGSGGGSGADRGAGAGNIGPQLPLLQLHQQLHAAKLQRRPSMSHQALAPVIPPCVAAALPGLGAGGCGATGAGSAAGGPQQLIAEGRSIQRSTTSVDVVDPWLVAYRDINGTADTDSLCATPPRLDIGTLARHAAGGATGGAFGPLTPCPLSPSILTLCARPGLDDNFVLNSTADLIDMRSCQSPTLPRA